MKSHAKPRNRKAIPSAPIRHPMSVAYDAFRNAQESSPACNIFDPNTLGRTACRAEFLRNRLSTAFDAGWAAAEAFASSRLCEKRLEAAG